MKRLWSRLHFLIRFLGLTGFLAACVGGALGYLHGLWPDLQSAWATSWRALAEKAQALITEEASPPVATVAVYLVAAGAAATLVALLIEILGMLWYAAGRRSAFGANASAQAALAVVLLVGLNAWSFSHHRRFDWTRGETFTIDARLQEELRRLQAGHGRTTVLVYLRHKTFGQLSDKPDAYDYAAERKVVEKVKDLVEQLREFGPQFRVEVLDVEEEGYDEKLARVTRQAALDREHGVRFAERDQERAEQFEQQVAAGAQEMRDAVENSPENSIFFFGQGRTQRLSFNSFFQLDKSSSQEANKGRGNLVLLSQGIGPFVRKVLNLDEKRPKVAVVVIHEVLGLNGSEELGMAGVRKVLAGRGFDAHDVILKKWSEFGPPEPAAYTFDENKLERLDEQIKELETNVKSRDEELRELSKLVKEWQTAPLDELARTELAKDLGLKRVNENLRKEVLAKVLMPNVSLRQFLNEDDGRDLATLRKERAGVQKAEETLAEQRRVSDLRAKTDRLLADSDLLIVPRMTLFNVARGERISNPVYRLDAAQVDAVQEFLKAGKPVLFCLGPTNEPPGARDPSEGGPDKLEDLLRDLGFKLPRQTVLFNVESKSFAERRSGLVIMGASVEVPPVKFDWPDGAGLPPGQAVAEALPPNPLRESLRLTARGLGKGQALDLRLRHPRPVYYDPPEDARPKFDPVFMMSDERSWNEGQPFPTRERTPRYEPPKADDAGKAPHERSRLGPFPVGVLAERPVPASWYTSEEGKPATARVALIGHGGVFMGNTLPPAREKLLLDTVNWLLDRDELTRGQTVWQYPRVALAERDKELWQYGAWLGPPVGFLYLGVVVLLVRRLR